MLSFHISLLSVNYITKKVVLYFTHMLLLLNRIAHLSNVRVYKCQIECILMLNSVAQVPPKLRQCGVTEEVFNLTEEFHGFSLLPVDFIPKYVYHPNQG